MDISVLCDLTTLMNESELPFLFSANLLEGCDEDKEELDCSNPQNKLIEYAKNRVDYRNDIQRSLLFPIRNFINKHWFLERAIPVVQMVATHHPFAQVFYEKRHTLRKICAVAVALERYNYRRIVGKTPELDDMPQALAKFSAFLSQMETVWPDLREEFRKRHLLICSYAAGFANVFVSGVGPAKNEIESE